MMRLKYLIMASLCCIGSMHAYIYELKVMRCWDEKSNGYKYCLLCSDFHDKTHTETEKQLTKLDAFLTKADKKSYKIVLEDLSSCGSDGRESCGRYFVNSRGGILGGLAQKCQGMGFQVDNVEYRRCRVASLGPVLNNLKEKPAKFPSSAGIKIAALSTEIDAMMLEIDSYCDGEVMGSCYKNNVSQVREHLAHLKQDKHQDMSVAEFIEHSSTNKDRLELLNHLLTFDSCLLDIKMVHNVLNSTTPKVMVIAGGAHAARVSQMLEKVGYQTIHATDVSFYNEYDLSKCVGSTVVNGSYCVRPQPIDLGCLDEYV